MINLRKIKIEDYNYNLPVDRIAKYPLEQRDQSKLLVYNKGEISQKQFTDLDQCIEPESTLVFNNTKVIQARLQFQKPTGAQIEIFCLEPVEPSDYAISFQQKEKILWKCIVGNLKKWKSGSLIKKIFINNTDIELKATRLNAEGDAHLIEFIWDKTDFTFGEIIENIGLTPIPPYLNRESETIDRNRYQTIYSKLKGSVAAPTAGLHFTNNVLEQMRNKGIQFEEITLHVGAGTFKPVQTKTIDAHEMHTEHFIISKETIYNIQKAKIITAVGTTSVRTVESLYWIGVKILNSNTSDNHISQWEIYNLPQNVSREKALGALLEFMVKNKDDILHASTQIIIIPGYSFKMTDGLITNFHQPKSTLLLLIAAFIGDDWRKVYDFALNNNFRFLSYGDSSILTP